MRSPENVVAEIRECVNKYHIGSINFSDEFFTANQDRVRAICRLMISERLIIPWVCMARAENIADETLQLMKSAGCREISFGIESGNAQMLARIDKKLDLNMAMDVVRRTQALGIKTHASYIIGYLGETHESIQDTINFSIKLNTDIAAFFIASPLPGSDFYEEAKKNGLIRKDASWADYSPLSNNVSVVNLPGLSLDEIRYWHRKAIRKYYVRFVYIFSRLLRLKHGYEVRNLISGFRTLLSIHK
jgi:radical SAM superfamily enzyme YgiQ (UPF0313 family)